jgi:hypothetical protein
MIDIFGPYLLVLIVTTGGVAIHEMSSFDACQAALVQLQPVTQLYGFCIAKEIVE